MKYLFGLALIVLIAASCNNQKNEPSKPVATATPPVDTSAVVDSILERTYSASGYAATYADLMRWDSCTAHHIDSSLQAIMKLPNNWKEKAKRIKGLDTLKYLQLPRYARLSREAYELFRDQPKIVKPVPIVRPIQIDDQPKKKPVVYLYPVKEQKTTVHIDFKGKDLYTWPPIPANLTWDVTAQPDGTLTDAYGEEYPYLFWEGRSGHAPYADLTEGFVVAAGETEVFFRNKLKFLGLTAKEYTDFITFWGPILRKNDYNFIRFETTAYHKDVPMTVSPTPDCIQRILMVYMPVPADYQAKPQPLAPFTRKGFTVIEWGGEEVREGAGGD